ncbi:hypothetical protein V6N13_035231 [Hibiscus sabdariffa]
MHHNFALRGRYPLDNGYKEVTVLPSRGIVYDQAKQLFGLRHKPIAQQDALPKPEFQPRFLPRQDPLANPRGPRLDLDPEIERTQKQLKRRIRRLMEHNNGQPPGDGQGLPAQADGAIAPPIPSINQQPPARTVRDYLAEDLEGLNPAVTMPEFEAEHFELKPLKLFPYSLRDKAKTWLNNLQPGSLQSWTQLCRSSLVKFSYTNMTDHLRNQITSFRQEDDEAMHEAWEHYRDLFRRCPMHGLPEWTQVSIFYNSVNTPTRMMLDASANVTLLDKPPRESLEIMDKLAQNDYQHPTSRRGTTRRGPAQLDSSDTILA